MKTIEQRLKDLETPSFKRALDALTIKRPMGLCNQGQTDSWLKNNVDAEAATAWRAYKDVEDLLP
jgi:hypothetical protein